MTPSTKNKLLAINKQFYEERADDFAKTRDLPWRGWIKLFNKINTWPNPTTVLDYGCGHGRFLDFLGKQIDTFTYIGVDNSPNLLTLALRRFAKEKRARFIQKSNLVAKETFDLIAVFGVMHHIPDLAERQKILLKLFNNLKPNGYLVVTFWQLERKLNIYKKRATEKVLKDLGIDDQDLEQNDYLMPFGDTPNSWRYVHLFDSKEIEIYKNNTELKMFDDFEADGKSGKQNHYLVFQRV